MLVPLSFVAIRSWTSSDPAALLTALLVALDQSSLHWAHQARTYAIVQLVGLVQMMSFWRLVMPSDVFAGNAEALERETSHRRSTAAAGSFWGPRAMLVIATATLFYLHYTAVLLLVAELVFYTVAYFMSGPVPGWRAISRYLPRHVLVDVLAITLVCLPATTHLLEIAARRENWSLFIFRPSIFGLLGPMPFELFVIVPLLTFTGLGHLRPALPLLLSWFAVPVVIAWAVSHFDLARLFAPRYLAVAKLAPLVFIAIAVAFCPARYRRIALLSALIVMSISSGRLAYHYRQHGTLREDVEDWRSAIEHVRENDPRRELPVLVRSGLIESEALGRSPDEALRAFSLLPVTTLYSLSNPNGVLVPLPRSLTFRIEADLAGRIAAAGGAWLVSRGDPASADAYGDQILIALSAHGVRCRVTLRKPFTMVNVLRLSAARSRSRLASAIAF